ncbi:MAG: hypothetical protein HKN29_16080 [Rhodothermales bacterium]|nr:hypothetical protein [Rhodothermales bacterium]
MTHKGLTLLLALLLTACDVVNHGDEEPHHGHGDGVQATTVLTSSSLATRGSAGKAAGHAVKSASGGTDYLVTPFNVSGEILSVVFPIDPAPDDGIVVFGDGRPDIAPTSATLLPFDLVDHDPVNEFIDIKPTLADGTVERVHPLFGYADFFYDQDDGTPRTVRVAMASVNGMVRGDKLLDMGGGQFFWFDLDTSAFTSARPSNPAVIEAIRDFTDPIRPNLVFFPMVVNLTSTIGVTAADFLAAATVESEVDFYMGNGITLLGQTTSNLTDAETIQSFTLTQMSTGFGGASGFTADAVLNPLP